jgi:hypothetical protein
MWQGTIVPATWTSECYGHESVEPSPITVRLISTIYATAGIGLCRPGAVVIASNVQASLGAQYEWVHSMKTISHAAIELGFCALLATGCAPAWAAQAYEGFWASTKKDCRDEDSANRMSIEGGNRLYWYETRCQASEIKPDGERAWKMRLACEGEGEKFKSSPRVSIAGDGRLVIENGPVGQAKRQTYLRCESSKAR